MPYADLDVIDMVEDLCEVESGLTEWEVGFVDSVAKSIDEQKDEFGAASISEKQHLKILELWNVHC